jgi:DHA3 family macrolide efflux protein-like MFS transporter
MSYFTQRLALLKLPVFRNYLASCALATTGGGLTYIALIWLVLQDKNSVGSVAMVMLCFWLPGVILGPFMGVIVDRIQSRNLLLVFSNWTRALVLVIFGVLFYYHQTLIDIYVLGLILGTFFSIYIPAAFRLTREIIPESQLLYANATIDMVFEVGNMVGMGLAGLLISLTHAAGTLLINAALFIISGALLFFVRVDKSKHQTVENRPFSLWADFKAGLTYITSVRTVLLLYTIQLIIFIEFLTAPVLLAPYAKNILHADATQFGNIEMMLSIGAIVGGIFLAWVAESFGLIRSMLVITVILGLSYIFFSHNQNIWLAEALYFAIGVCFATWPLIITKAQAATEINFQGRVQSCFNSISGLVMILIYLAIKLGSQYISIQALYSLEVVFTVIAFVLLIIANRHID